MAFQAETSAMVDDAVAHCAQLVAMTTGLTSRIGVVGFQLAAATAVMTIRDSGTGVGEITIAAIQMVSLIKPLQGCVCRGRIESDAGLEIGADTRVGAIDGVASSVTVDEAEVGVEAVDEWETFRTYLKDHEVNKLERAQHGSSLSVSVRRGLAWIPRTTKRREIIMEIMMSAEDKTSRRFKKSSTSGGRYVS